MCYCSSGARKPGSPTAPSSPRPAPKASCPILPKISSGITYRYVQRPMQRKESPAGTEADKTPRSSLPAVGGHPYSSPGEDDMCSHFRKPFSKNSKLTSRDKVYESIDSHIMAIQSTPCDYSIDPSWASQGTEQAPAYSTRRHRPYKFEFFGAEYWPWTTLRARLEAEMKGLAPCLPRAYNDRVPLKPRDPTATLTDESTPDQGPTGEITPQRKARLLVEEHGWHRNPWKKLWGATVNDNPIIHCPNCNCYVLPPVPDLSYLDAHHEQDSCYKDRGCYYSSYLPTKWRPETGTTWNSEYGRFYRGPDDALSYSRPPINWWVTEVPQPYYPPPPDYSLLTPSFGAPPDQSIYEINSVSKVKSQWTP